MDLPVNDERPEWEALLAALDEANDTFTFLELGAGYGRWTTRAHNLAVERGLQPMLVAVEAEPHHFAALHASLNGEAILIRAAVASRSGRVPFSTGNSDQYGQQILTRPRPALHWLRRGGRVRLVRAVSLDDVLAPYPRVDLIDIDVQGAEVEILAAADLGRVRRVHVGTHSRSIEARLRGLFTGLGWEFEADYAGDGERETPWGTVEFEDGAQTWRNMHV